MEIIKALGEYWGVWTMLLVVGCGGIAIQMIQRFRRKGKLKLKDCLNSELEKTEDPHERGDVIRIGLLSILTVISITMLMWSAFQKLFNDLSHQPF